VRGLSTLPVTICRPQASLAIAGGRHGTLRLCLNDVPGDGASSGLGRSSPAVGARPDHHHAEWWESSERTLADSCCEWPGDQDQVFCAPAIPAGLNHINDVTPPHPPGRQAGPAVKQRRMLSLPAGQLPSRLQPTVNN